MIDEKQIEAALDAAFDVAERLEAILLAARSESRRSAARERIQSAPAESNGAGEAVEPGEALPVRVAKPAPEGEVWLLDLANELEVSDSQFYVWHRQRHIGLIKHGARNALRLSDAWRLREIASKRPERFKTNARWIGAWFRGDRD